MCTPLPTWQNEIQLCVIDTVLLNNNGDSPAAHRAAASAGRGLRGAGFCSQLLSEEQAEHSSVSRAAQGGGV